MDYPKIESLLTLAEHAGAAIMKIYDGAIEVEQKADSSPLTQADLAAHKVIAAGLSSLTPDIPVLSEEGGIPGYSERQGWQCYWLVDPLDGTKEFIKRNGEFTVNIALIENGRAVRSVVLAPALGTAYWGCNQEGAFKRDADGKVTQIRCRQLPEKDWKVLVSRSHRAPEVDALLSKIPPHEPVSAGSSLKFCLIAEGSADFYPRLGLTSEWDTGAGQCVLEAAGGAVIKTDGKALRYNSKEELLNPHFLAVSTTRYDWVSLLAES
ncbi:MAG: 3'(2'),5'-bisphosphate nucleotidase CysQ [Oceanococcus sp.]